MILFAQTNTHTETNEKMNKSKKLKYCVIANIIVLTMVIILSIVYRDDSDYWNLGPNKNLIVISVHIDTLNKYFLLLLVIAVINISKVIIEEIGMPILSFNIYNPDKKIINEFTRFELQLYGNVMYFTSGIRGVFMLMINIAQIDIAIFNVIVCEVASIFTIRMLLNEKKFISSNDNDSISEDMQELRINIAT